MEITLITRHNNNHNDLLADHTVNLYEFAVGLKPDFPKETLSRNSKYKEVRQDKNIEASEEVKDTKVSKDTFH